MEPNEIRLDDGVIVNADEVSEVVGVRKWRRNEDTTWSRIYMRGIRYDDTNEMAGELTEVLETIDEREYFKQKLAGLI